MKKTLNPADLLARLEQEFERRKPRGCESCYVSPPFRLERPNAVGADWDVMHMGACAQACILVLDELVAEFQRLYALAPSGL